MMNALGQHPTDQLTPAERVEALQKQLLNGEPGTAQVIERTIRLLRLEALVREAEWHSTLREHQFNSAVPLFGRLIAAFRSTLYGLGARWAIRSLIEQQNVFNQALAHSLAESTALNRHLIDRIEALEQRVAELERERRF